MDLMFTAKDLIGLYYNTTESLFLLVIFYLIILLPVSLLGTYFEHRFSNSGKGQVSKNTQSAVKKNRRNTGKEVAPNVGN